MAKIFQGTQAAWKIFLKPAINAAAPVVGLALAANSKNAAVGKATTNILKSKRGGKILNLTYMLGHALRRRVM